MYYKLKGVVIFIKITIYLLLSRNMYYKLKGVVIFIKIAIYLLLSR